MCIEKTVDSAESNAVALSHKVAQEVGLVVQEGGETLDSALGEIQLVSG